MKADTYAYRAYYRKPAVKKGGVPDPILRALRKGWTLVWPLAASGSIVALVALAIYFYAYAHEEGFRFQNPWALLLLLGMPLSLLADVYLRTALSARLTFTKVGLIKTMPGRAKARALILLPGVLRGAVIGLVALAIARPQATSVREEREVEGIDIVIALDMSGSMKAADMPPSRLEAAKEVIDEFVKRRVNDRIGLVVFGRYAVTACPLTRDYNVLRNLVRSLQFDQIDGNGTAIGNALGTAINRLRKSTAKTRIIVLLTDGANNAGNISPQQAAEFAKALGINIYTILAGREEEAPVEVDTDLFGRGIFEKSRFPLNPELLRSISEETGGRFYTAQDRRALEESFHALLDSLERTKLPDVGVAYAETFHRFLIPALLLFLIEIAMRFTISRKTP